MTSQAIFIAPSRSDILASLPQYTGRELQWSTLSLVSIEKAKPWNPDGQLLAAYANTANHTSGSETVAPPRAQRVPATPEHHAGGNGPRHLENHIWESSHVVAESSQSQEEPTSLVVSGSRAGRQPFQEIARENSRAPNTQPHPSSVVVAESQESRDGEGDYLSADNQSKNTARRTSVTFQPADEQSRLHSKDNDAAAVLNASIFSGRTLDLTDDSMDAVSDHSHGFSAPRRTVFDESADYDTRAGLAERRPGTESEATVEQSRLAQAWTHDASAADTPGEASRVGLTPWAGARSAGIRPNMKSCQFPRLVKSADLTIDESSSTFAGGESIPPPPSLHFLPSALTSITDVLRDPRPWIQARKQISVLVLVREVGEVKEVTSTNWTGAGRNRIGADPERSTTLRAEMVVMDKGYGLLRVVLWDHCASEWAGEEVNDDMSIDDPSVAASFRPAPLMPLRPGDVVALSGLTIALDAPTGLGASTRRLGPGQPRIPFQGQVTAGAPIAAHAVASPRTRSAAEMCYRSDVRNTRDARINFDEAFAVFDRQRRLVSPLIGLGREMLGR